MQGKSRHAISHMRGDFFTCKYQHSHIISNKDATKCRYLINVYIRQNNISNNNSIINISGILNRIKSVKISCKRYKIVVSWKDTCSLSLDQIDEKYFHILRTMSCQDMSDCNPPRFLVASVTIISLEKCFCIQRPCSRHLYYYSFY